MQFGEIVSLLLFYVLPVVLVGMVTCGLVSFFSFVMKVKIAKGVYESDPMLILLMATGAAVISLLYVMWWEKQMEQPFLYPLQQNFLTPVEALVFTIA